MKPLPAQRSLIGKPNHEGLPSVPIVVTHAPVVYSEPSQHSQAACATQRSYPFLLLASTGVAALFCFLYVTKPVSMTPNMAISSPPEVKPPLQDVTPAVQASADTEPSLYPNADVLPGEAVVDLKPPMTHQSNQIPVPSLVSPFEETNLRVQHVLTAESADGQFDRIVLDVPVLYQSRNLRWTSSEVAEARSLLIRMMDYQDQSRELRAKGVELLDAWNQLIEKSIPATELRADTPSLAANQQDVVDLQTPSKLISTEAIRINPTGK